MEHWDGNKLHVEINPVSCYSFFLPLSSCRFVFYSAFSMFHFFTFFCSYLFFEFKGNIYRVELMHYAIFHPLNQADLPDELDVYRIGGRKIALDSSQ
jgi:hypothetical protein